MALGAPARAPPAPEARAWVVERRPIAPGPPGRSLVRLAKEEGRGGRRVLVYFHADWCGPCRAVQQVFQREGNRGLFARWVVVPVDVDSIPEGPVLGVDFAAIPFFIRLDASGRPDGTLDGNALGDPRDADHLDAVFHRFLGA